MLKLDKQEEGQVGDMTTTIRTYKNTLTNSPVQTYLLKKDDQGNKWWAFVDLFALPFIRQMVAKRVLDLYGNGLSLEDIKMHTSQIKALLRSSDAEKYDKAMSQVLALESLTESVADPVRQCMGLCTVYLLLNDEVPDVWTQNDSNRKMTIMSLDLSLQSFFLSWWTDIMRHSGQVLKGLSLIASTMDLHQSATSTKEQSG